MDRGPGWYLLHGSRAVVGAVAGVGLVLSLLVLLVAALGEGTYGLFILWAALVGLAQVGGVVLVSALVLALAAPSLLGRPDPLGFDALERRLLQVAGVLLAGGLVTVALVDPTAVSALTRSAVRAGLALGWIAGGVAVASRLRARRADAARAD